MYCYNRVLQCTARLQCTEKNDAWGAASAWEEGTFEIRVIDTWRTAAWRRTQPSRELESVTGHGEMALPLWPLAISEGPGLAIVVMPAAVSGTVVARSSGSVLRLRSRTQGGCRVLAAGGRPPDDGVTRHLRIFLPPCIGDLISALAGKSAGSCGRPEIVEGEEE